MKQFVIYFAIFFAGISLMFVLIAGLMAWRGVIDNESMHQRIIKEQQSAILAYQGKMTTYMDVCTMTGAPSPACALAFGRGGH